MLKPLTTQVDQIRTAFANHGAAIAKSAGRGQDASAEVEVSPSSSDSFRVTANRFNQLQSKVTGAEVDPSMSYNAVRVGGKDVWSATKQANDATVVMQEEQDYRSTYLSTGTFSKDTEITDDFNVVKDPFSQSVEFVDECFIVGLPGQSKAVLTRTWREPGHENIKVSVDEEHFAAFSDKMAFQHMFISTL